MPKVVRAQRLASKTYTPASTRRHQRPFTLRVEGPEGFTASFSIPNLTAHEPSNWACLSIRGVQSALEILMCTPPVGLRTNLRFELIRDDNIVQQFLILRALLLRLDCSHAHLYFGALVVPSPLLYDLWKALSVSGCNELFIYDLTFTRASRRGTFIPSNNISTLSLIRIASLSGPILGLVSSSASSIQQLSINSKTASTSEWSRATSFHFPILKDIFLYGRGINIRVLCDLFSRTKLETARFLQTSMARRMVHYPISNPLNTLEGAASMMACLMQSGVRATSAVIHSDSKKGFDQRVLQCLKASETLHRLTLETSIISPPYLPACNEAFANIGAITLDVSRLLEKGIIQLFDRILTLFPNIYAIVLSKPASLVDQVALLERLIAKIHYCTSNTQTGIGFEFLMLGTLSHHF